MRARPSAFAASVGPAGASRAGRAAPTFRHGRRAKADDSRPKDGRGRLKKPYPVWLVTTAAFILPGSGQWLNGDPTRGAVMQFFMMLLAYLTYMMSTPQTSFIGRFAGGFLVWVFAIIDANGIAKRRVKAWERMTRGGEQPGIEGKDKPETFAATAAKPATDNQDRKARSSTTDPRPGKAPATKGRPGAAGARQGGGRQATPQKRGRKLSSG